MKDREGLMFIIFLYFFVVILSPAIFSTISNYAHDTTVCGIYTFLIAFIIDSIGICAMMKFGFEKGIAEGLNLVFLNAFPFILFYLLAIGMIDYSVREISDFLNFINF